MACAAARGERTGRLPRAQMKGAQKRPEGRGTGPDNLFLLIQFQDEQKITIFAIFAQGAKIPGYGSPYGEKFEVTHVSGKATLSRSMLT
jgi:hypothetical protein